MGPQGSTILIPNIIMHNGKTLRTLRMLKKISQQQLGEKLKVTQQYVSELENNKHINGEKLEEILNALNSSREEWERIRRTAPRS